MKIYRWVVVSCVALLLTAAVAKSLYGMVAVVPTVAEYTALPVIVIDPGHGGIDGGAVGVDDIVEKDINLAISLTLRDMFAASGFQVVMTRETDMSIHDEGITSTRGQKVSDIHNRMDLVNQYPGAVFLSIHQNKFGDSRSKGAQIFFGPKNKASEKLAKILQEDFSANLQPENKRQCKKAEKNLYLMYHATCPSVLIECGFLSNPGEAAQLVDPDYQSRIAFSAYSSVLRFLELDTPVVPPQELTELSPPQ